MADSEDERGGGKCYIFAVFDIALALQSPMKFAQFFAIFANSTQESRLRIYSDYF